MLWLCVFTCMFYVAFPLLASGRYGRYCCCALTECTKVVDDKFKTEPILVMSIFLMLLHRTKEGHKIISCQCVRLCSPENLRTLAYKRSCGSSLFLIMINKGIYKYIVKARIGYFYEILVTCKELAWSTLWSRYQLCVYQITFLEDCWHVT